jgi:DNA polymerase-3 subunit alpha
MWMSSERREEVPYPDMDEFPESQLITFEKETLGFYITRHPLTRFEEVIRKHTSEDTSILMARKNGGEIKICGLVSELKEIVTKKGDRMAFLTLEDTKGFVEVILFPEVFKAALPYVRGSEPILVRGTLDPSDEHVKIKATEVQAFQSGLWLEDLHVKIPLASLTPPQLEELRGLIAENKGDYKVWLHLVDVKERETVIALSDQFTVEPSSRFQDHLRTLFQSSRISLE